MLKRDPVTKRTVRVTGGYHVTANRAEDVLPCDRDTEPGFEPSQSLLTEVACCVGMLASGGRGYHSSDCAETTAVETPKALKVKTPYPPKRYSVPKA
jgi:hypothetical protein